MEVSMFNSEGYRDPTPHDAISSLMRGLPRSDAARCDFFINKGRQDVEAAGVYRIAVCWR